MNPSEHSPRAITLELTDHELLGLVHAGTTGAFATLYARHIGSIGDHVVAKVPDLSSHQIQAVTGEAFLSVLKRLLMDPIDEPHLNIMAEVISKADSGATEMRSVRSERPGLFKMSQSKLQYASPDFSQIVAEAFASRPEHWRRILWLIRVEDLPFDVAAKHLGSDARRVKRLSRRAERDLRLAAKQRFFREDGCVWEKSSVTLKRSDSGGGLPGYPEEPRTVRETGSPLDGKVDQMSTDLRTALIHAVLCSPALIEQFAETIVAVRTQGFDARCIEELNTSLSKVTTPTKYSDAQCAGDLSDKLLKTQVGGFTSGPGLVLAVIGSAVISVTVLFLGFTWESRDQDETPAGSSVDESSTAPLRTPESAEDETSGGGVGGSHPDLANEGKSAHGHNSPEPSKKEGDSSGGAPPNNDEPNSEARTPVTSRPPSSGNTLPSRTSGPPDSESPVGEPPEPSTPADPTPSDEPDPPSTEAPTPTKEPEPSDTEEPSGGADASETPTPD
ncbi:hypothetical protein FO013_15030 [Brevibacterium aurantiacum]|uniref:Sigma-70 family RNA polymerase sigma factor n=1 Tax=Brevibacterium aurantiacum TaxID=273384 RepID=A0A556C9E4_BREAU|nr:hypothetical protein FO013_15030 [Brevibacterium aurantiacum]